MTLLDTNVLLRIAEPGSPTNSIAVAAVRQLSQGEELVIVPQVAYEFWMVATRSVTANGLGMSVIDADNELSAILRLYRVLDDIPDILPEWKRLVRSHSVKGVKTHDARIAAAMSCHSVQQLLTFNAGDFQKYPGITVISPESIVVSP